VQGKVLAEVTGKKKKKGKRSFGGGKKGKKRNDPGLREER